MVIDGWTASESLISVAQASHFTWTPLEPQPCSQGSQLEQPVCVGCDVEAILASRHAWLAPLAPLGALE